jgi:hypothetical protein
VTYAIKAGAMWTALALKRVCTVWCAFSYEQTRETSYFGTQLPRMGLCFYYSLSEGGAVHRYTTIEMASTLASQITKADKKSFKNYPVAEIAKHRKITNQV